MPESNIEKGIDNSPEALRQEFLNAQQRRAEARDGANNPEDVRFQHPADREKQADKVREIIEPAAGGKPAGDVEHADPSVSEETAKILAELEVLKSQTDGSEDGLKHVLTGLITRIINKTRSGEISPSESTKLIEEVQKRVN